MSDDIFTWPDNDGPVERDALDATIATVQDQLDLVAVLTDRYRVQTQVAGERWRSPCFLPSLVEGFEGSCAEQDASEHGGARAIPQNLWVSEGELTRVWRCHSCQRRGDVIDLIMYAEGFEQNPGQVASLRALRLAAQLVGCAYVLDGRAPNNDDEPSEMVRTDRVPRIVRPTKASISFDDARKLNAKATKHWRALLQSGPGYKARAEFKRRGVTLEQVERYYLGYAHEMWRDFVGQIPETLVKRAQLLGLIGLSKNDKLYDRYRDRIMFPYCVPAEGHQPAGVTGFAGRTLSKDKRAPKWLNSPNTPGVWVKSESMLGTLQAQDKVQKFTRGKYCRLAVGEGGWEMLAFDRIDAPATGLVSAVLSLGHVTTIAETLGANRVTLAFDGDETGRRAVFDGIVTLLRYGYAAHDISVIDSPDGQDPDSTPEDELRLAWERPMAIDSFIHGRASLARAGQQRALVATVQPSLAKTLALVWGLDAAEITDQASIDSPDATNASKLVLALLESPTLAGAIDGANLREILAGEGLALRQLASLEFGNETQPKELPPQARAAWLACVQDHTWAQIKAHDVSDPFANGNSADVYRAWFQRGEDLRTFATKIKRQLDALTVHE